MKENYIEKTVVINNIVYRLSDDFEATIVDNLINTIIDIVIEGTIDFEDNEYKVVAIGDGAFQDNHFIDSLQLPSTIKEVGKNAFKGSSLQYVDFVQMVALHEVVLGEACFMDNIRLDSVRLPAGLIEIPKFSFANCISLSKINTPERLLRINEMAFYKASNLKHFDFVPGIVELGNSSFRGTNLFYGEIGPRVQRCGDFCFADIDNLFTMVIANADLEIGECFMKNEKRVTIYVKGVEESSNITGLLTNISEHHYTIIDNFSLSDKQGIKYLIFSNNTARIIDYNETVLKPYTKISEKIDGAKVIDFGPGFMKYSDKIEKIIFPKSIIRIKGKLFEGCTNIREVTFQHNIKMNEAKWVVSNDKASIVLKDTYSLKEYEARIECITTTEEGIPLQKSFIEVFEASSKKEAYNEVKDYCDSNSDEKNEFRLINLYKVS